MIEEKVQEIQKFLKDHSQKIGLGKLVSYSKTEYYLNISPENLRKLSSQECAEAANILVRQSLFIQGQINYEQAIAKWCAEYIDYIIAPSISKQGDKFTPYPYRKSMAIAQEPVAIYLHKMLSRLKLKIENMNFLQSRLDKVAETFTQLYFSKREK